MGGGGGGGVGGYVVGGVQMWVAHCRNAVPIRKL